MLYPFCINKRDITYRLNFHYTKNSEAVKSNLQQNIQGGQLVKVRSASRVYRRFYWLDEGKKASQKTI